MKWDESKHPRDEHGQFAKSGTPRTYRQNASYSEITRSSEDAELSAFNEYLAKNICEAFGIDPGEDAKQSFYDYLEKSRQEYTPAPKIPNHKFKLNPKYFSKSDEMIPFANPNVEFHKGHLDRLKIMWSDYEFGTSTPVEKNGVKFFNVDNTIYRTIGEYPNFKVINSKTYEDTFKLEQTLKRLKYGKR